MTSSGFIITGVGATLLFAGTTLEETEDNPGVPADEIDGLVDGFTGSVFHLTTFRAIND